MSETRHPGHSSLRHHIRRTEDERVTVKKKKKKKEKKGKKKKKKKKKKKRPSDITKGTLHVYKNGFSKSLSCGNRGCLRPFSKMTQVWY